jgi:hypothetical protein
MAGFVLRHSNPSDHVWTWLTSARSDVGVPVAVDRLDLQTKIE